MSNLLRGLSYTPAKQLSPQLVNSIRNMLILIEDDPFIHDLFSLNVQRGRDHGMP